MVLSIFKELETQDLINTRRYIYEILPENIEELDNKERKANLLRVELALIAFDRIGYLVHHFHIDKTTVMENYWYSIWRCWKKSKTLIAWAREQRAEPHYFTKFEYLFDLSEAYRIENDLKAPKFY